MERRALIAALVVTLGALSLLAWVLAPLLRGPVAETGQRSQLIEDAEGRKRAALYALIDIEEEAEIGKLSPADLEVLRNRYEHDAMDALRRLDELNDVATGAPDDLESEIARLKQQMRCPNCGATRPPQQACPRCGKE
jgi:rubrerythrin